MGSSKESEIAKRNEPKTASIMADVTSMKPTCTFEGHAMIQSLFDGIIFGTVEGLLLGLLPIITGMKKNQPWLAIGGFFIVPPINRVSNSGLGD